MTLLFSSVLLGLVWFAVVNLIASLAVWAIATCLVGTGPEGRRNSNVLLLVRLLPALIALVFSLVVFLPAHWRFEPPDTNERFGVVLGSLAALSLALFGRSLWRALAVTRACLRFRRHTRSAVPLSGVDAAELAGVSGVVLAGVFRPQVVVGPEASAVLTAAELEVAVAHEMAHKRSRDNVKAFAMFCAPDVFGWSETARRLEARWRAAAECLADAEAVQGNERRALALATALVKVARLSGPRSAPLDSPVWSSLHEPGLLETRVRQLLHARPMVNVPGMMGVPARWGAALAAVGVASGAWLAGYGFALHRLTETLVTILP